MYILPEGVFYKNYFIYFAVFTDVYRVLSYMAIYMTLYIPIVMCALILFTTTTVFATIVTVIIEMCSLKSMCMPHFILIGCGVSELHGYLCLWSRLFYKNYIVYIFISSELDFERTVEYRDRDTSPIQRHYGREARF